MPAPAISISYVSENVGLCSTYSTRTRSGPQRKTAYVFGASTTSSISTPRSFAAAMCSSADSTSTARWLSSGFSGAPGSPGWNSTYAPPTSTRGAPDGAGRGRREAERAVLAGRLLRARARRARRGRGRTRRRSRPRRARAARLRRRRRSRPRRRAAARPRARRAARRAPRRDSRRGTRRASSAPRSRGPSASKSVSLPAARVRAEQRERVGPVDDVHAEMRRHEVGDRRRGRRPSTRRGRASSGSCLDVTRSGYGLCRATCVDRRPLELLPSSSASGPRCPSASPRCRAAPSCGPSAGSCRSGARRAGRTRCRARDSRESRLRLAAPAPAPC